MSVHRHLFSLSLDRSWYFRFFNNLFPKWAYGSHDVGFKFQITSIASQLPFLSAVYFNPAKTVGAMIEADLFYLFGLFYSAFVCLTSMSMFWWLERKPGLE